MGSFLLKTAPVLLILLCAATFVSSELVIEDSPNPDIRDLTLGDDECILPCYVKHVGDTNLTNAPSVSWSKILEDTTIHPLKDDIWYYRNVIFEYKDQCTRNCPRDENNCGVYDCGMKFKNCNSTFYSDYICSVHAYDTGSPLKVRVSAKPYSDSFSSPCFMPKAYNLTAKLVTGANGLLSLKVSWNVTEKPARVSYCNKSRQWSVRSFNSSSSYSFKDSKEPKLSDFHYDYINTKDRRDTFYIFENVTRNRYYQFQILNKKRKYDTKDYVTQNFTSMVYYFGEQAPATMVYPAEDIVIQREVGDSLTLRCEATGSPSPKVYILKQITDVWTSDETTATGITNIKIFNSLNLTDSGTYFCLAINVLVGPPEGKRTVQDLKRITLNVVEVNRTDISNTIHCTLYDGSLCSPYIYNTVPVYVNGEITGGKDDEIVRHNVQNLMSQIEDLASSNTMQLNPILLDKCRRFAEAMVCHTLLPYCDQNLYEPTGRPICRDSCDVFRRGGTCEAFINNVTSPLLALELLKRCDKRVNPAGTIPECIPISLEAPEKVTAASDISQPLKHISCGTAESKGRDFGGYGVQTISGRYCQAWSSQYPHAHPFDPQKYPKDLQGMVISHSCRNPGGVGEKPWCYTVDRTVRWEYCDVPTCGACTRYKDIGGFCDIPGYNDDNATVYYNRKIWSHSINTANHEMLHIYRLLVNKDSDNMLTAGCDLALKQLLCHTTLPLCNSNRDYPSPRKMCSGQCELQNTLQFCSYDVFEELMKLWNENPKKYHIPTCPSSLSATQADYDCMPTPSRMASNTNFGHHSCYNTSDKGQSYVGQISTTINSSIPCLMWNKNYRLFNSALYPELSGSENYCRNPGQLRQRPWCFVSESEWAYCAVSSDCSSDENIEKNVDPHHTTKSNKDFVYPIVFLITATLTVLVIIVSAIFGYRHWKRKQAYLSNSPFPFTVHHKRTFPSDMKMVENDNYVSLPSKMTEVMKKFQSLDKQLNRSSIRYIRQIGQGNFGVVFQGKMPKLTKDEAGDDGDILVAVKTLKDDCPEALEDFAREARIMLQFDHPNIIKLYGVCSDDVPYYLVFEYMDQGDLAKFLRSQASSEQRRLMNNPSSRNSRTGSTVSNDPASLSSEQLTDMCKQIVKGMEFLSSKDYVHRDLACRNCLVKTCFDTGITKSGYIIKIGDFGMSHDLYQRNYYRVEGRAVLPVRWMSPEAIIYGKFSTAGDVWSFGVVMWEIFSYAMQPYYGISNEEVTKLVRTGQHLTRPNDCPRSIYGIMEHCWSAEPLERPSFKDLFTMLNSPRSSISSESCVSTYSTSQSDDSETDSDAYLEENSIDGVFIDAFIGDSQA